MFGLLIRNQCGYLRLKCMTAWLGFIRVRTKPHHFVTASQRQGEERAHVWWNETWLWRILSKMIKGFIAKFETSELIHRDILSWNCLKKFYIFSYASNGSKEMVVCLPFWFRLTYFKNWDGLLWNFAQHSWAFDGEAKWGCWTLEFSLHCSTMSWFWMRCDNN